MDNQTLLQIAPFIFIFAIMYFLLFRPQQQRMKQLPEMVEGVRHAWQRVRNAPVPPELARE